jgi:hypothetical protein
MTERVGMEVTPEMPDDGDAPIDSKRRIPKGWKITGVIFATVIILMTAFLYVMIQGSDSQYPSIVTGISTGKIGTYNYTEWTVVSDHTLKNILKSDVCVTVRNATGIVVLGTPLAVANGTHGFLYVPVTNGIYISPGDVFALSTDYKANCTFGLTSLDGTKTYCALTVPATIPPPSENPLWIIATVIIAAIAIISVAIIAQRRERSRKKQ